MAMTLRASTDLLGLETLGRSEIEALLQTAAAFHRQDPGPILRGHTALLLFAEPSTRTRTSFEVAARRLGLGVLSLSSGTSSLTKGETLVDTVETARQLGAEAVVVRAAASGAAELLARRTGLPVVNAGDGCHEHPTQALLDLYTLRQHFGEVAGLRVTIVGDILHSRVARSNLWGLRALGAEVTLCGPATLLPSGLEAYARVTSTLKEALAGADAVMALRLQKERMEAGLLPNLYEYQANYGITPERLEWAAPHAVLMHPGPVNRGVEVTSAAADGPRSLIQRQVENGVYVRMAALARLFGEAPGCGY